MLESAGESVELLLGRGAVARAGGDLEAAIAAHTAVYRAARAGGDDRTAARAALELVIDCGIARGPAESNGWLERASSLLDGLPTSFEHGMLTYLRASRALNAGHDPAAAVGLASESAAIARAVGSVDGEMVSRALEGLALVSDGAVDAGMRRLDEAVTAALAGEVTQPELVMQICCHLIDACKRVRDLDRAAEWCRRVEELGSQRGDADLFAVCRIHYGDLQIWRADWTGADETLTSVAESVSGFPGREADAFVRLAELRRRQGRATEAAALVERAASHRLAPVVRAALALDSGASRDAADEAELFLRRIRPGDRFERVPALELLVAARLALGETAEADEAARELETIAAAAPTSLLRAAALLARGRVDSSTDPAAAATALADACDLYRESGAAYDAARASAELAVVLRALGRDEPAALAEARSREELGRLAGDAPRAAAGLTPREREILGELAAGRTNEAIATALVLSVRTVEHHVASIYRKIGVSGRGARAAAAAYAHANGLARR